MPLPLTAISARDSYVAGSVDRHHVMQMFKIVIRLPLVAIVYYHIAVYQGHFLVPDGSGL